MIRTNAPSNTVDIGFVQCTSSYINSLPAEELNPGTLYFLLDTKQILLCKQVEQIVNKETQEKQVVNTLISMGKSTGVRFANKTTDLKNVNTEIVFKLEDLQDKSCYPQIDDLIFNETDGCFYRVKKIKESNDEIITNRITVAGGGGGGGSYGNISGGGNVSIGMSLNEEDFSSIPSYVIYDSKSTITYPVYINLDLQRNGVSQTTAKSLTYDIYVGSGNKVLSGARCTPNKLETINIYHKWFDSKSDNAITIVFYHGDRNFEWNLKTVDCLDLRITPTQEFLNSIKKPFAISSFSYTGTFIKNENGTLSNAERRVYFQIFDTDSGEEVDRSDCYPSSAKCQYKMIIDEEKTITLTDNTEIICKKDDIITQEIYNKLPNGTTSYFESLPYYMVVSNDNVAINFKNISYGNYKLKIWQSIYVDETTFYTGAEYEYYFISVAAPIKNIPLISCDFSQIANKIIYTNSLVVVPTMIIDNSQDTTSGVVDILKNDQILKEKIPITLGEEYQLKFSNLPQGSYTLKIVYRYDNDTKEIWKQYDVEVFQAEVDETLKKPVVILTAAERQNLEPANKINIWPNTAEDNGGVEINPTFENFTWSDSESENGGTGWCSDLNGTDVLRISGDAKTVIDLNPFSFAPGYDVRTAGFTVLIDFLVQNFAKRDTTLIIDAVDQGVGFRVYGDHIEFLGANQPVRAYYMENQRMNIAFSASPFNNDQSNKGLFKLYVNGVLTGAKIYETKDEFTSAKIKMNIGSPDAIIDIYSIKAFAQDISFQQVIKEYLDNIQDLKDGELERIRNDLYQNGKITPEKIKQNTNLPYMILKGALPDKKKYKNYKVDIEFYHPDNQYCFSQLKVPIEVQGTSSQYYPRKNYKIKKVDPNGDKSGYCLAAGQIPTQTFCLKADYAESTSTHNTQNANFIETFYDEFKEGASTELLIKDNPAQAIRRQKNEPITRTTIFGYPIVVFQEINGETNFIGKYNFNFDKGSKEVFGFLDQDPETGEDIHRGESWEFKDNDVIAGFQFKGFEEAEKGTTGELFSWHKWRVTYSSRDINNETVTICFPLDIIDGLGNKSLNPETGYVEGCNTNIDYIREQAQEYLESKRGENDWWRKAQVETDRIIPMWATYFEARYCGFPQIDLNEKEVEYRTDAVGSEEESWETVYDISNFSKVYDWVMSTVTETGDLDTPKFTSEVKDYFDLGYLCIYYVYTHFAVMVDQRAKNMFFTYWYPADENGKIIPKEDTETKVVYGGKWQPWFYDNDTCFGINNAGQEVFSYSVEDDNTSAAEQVYQGEKSVLWRNLKAGCYSFLTETYNTLRAKKLKEGVLNSYFIDTASSWPAIIYNEDSQYKYIDNAYKPIKLGDEEDENAPTEDVLTMLRGNGVSHFQRFVSDRLMYCDGRWKNFNQNKALIVRPIQLEDNQTISMNIAFNLQPFTTGYYQYYFGGGSDESRTNLFVSDPKLTAGNTYLKEFGLSYSGKNVTYFANGDHIIKIGDLSQISPSQFTGSYKKLEELIMGNKERTPQLIFQAENGYVDKKGNEITEDFITKSKSSIDPNVVNENRQKILNIGLEALTLNTPSLKKLDFSNVSLTNQEISVTACPNIREIYGYNSYIKGINLPESGYLQKLVLPDTVQKIKLTNQLILTEEEVFFENNSVLNEKNPYRNLTTIRIENCPEFNSKRFLEKCLANNSNIVNYNIPDNYVSGMTKVIKITGIDYNLIKDQSGKMVPDPNDPWVFANVEEFEAFVSLFENSSIPLSGLDGVEATTDKPYLEGKCYILGLVDSRVKDSLKDRICGNFEILSDSTEYVIHFYRLDPITNAKEAIIEKYAINYEVDQTIDINTYENQLNDIINEEDKNIFINNMELQNEQYVCITPILSLQAAKPYIQVIYEGEKINNPYTRNGRLTNDEIYDYVEDKEHNGHHYAHGPKVEGCGWVKVLPGQLPTEQQRIDPDETIFKTVIDRTYDIYAVYVDKTANHAVIFKNNGSVLDATNDEYWASLKLPALIKHDTPFPVDKLPKIDDDHPLRKTGDPNELEWQFSGKWKVTGTEDGLPGDLNCVTKPLTCEAIYDYIARKTYKLIDKTIKVFKINEDSNLTSFYPYNFYKCNDLQQVILDVEGKINLIENTETINGEETIVDAFYDSKIATIPNDGSVKCIFVHPDYLEAYLADTAWKKYTNKIDIVGKEN